MTVAFLVLVKCKYCRRAHCEADAGAKIRFRCRRCKRMQVVKAGESP